MLNKIILSPIKDIFKNSNTLLKNGRDNVLFEKCKLVIQQYPNSPEANFILGCFYLKYKEYELAVHYLNKYLSVTSVNYDQNNNTDNIGIPIDTAEAYFYLGKAYYYLLDRKNAIDSFEKATNYRCAFFDAIDWLRDCKEQLSMINTFKDTPPEIN
ncbi:tetratricopeptide repeat protein [Candidatus Margulisiibacteriota bacterium]